MADFRETLEVSKNSTCFLAFSWCRTKEDLALVDDAQLPNPPEMKKNFTVCGMPYEQYLEFKYKNIARAIKAAMEANGWKEDEYEIK